MYNEVFDSVPGWLAAKHSFRIVENHQCKLSYFLIDFFISSSFMFSFLSHSVIPSQLKTKKKKKGKRYCAYHCPSKTTTKVLKKTFNKYLT